jgi:hypothetical protein
MQVAKGLLCPCLGVEIGRRRLFDNASVATPNTPALACSTTLG